MGQHPVVGILVIFIGVAIILNIIGLASLLIGPLILFGLALFLIRRKHPIFGLILALIGVSTLTKHLFHFNVVSLGISLIFIYLGLRLITGQGRRHHRTHKKSHKINKEKEMEEKEPLDFQFDDDQDHDWIDEEMEQLNKENGKKSKHYKGFKENYQTMGSTVRSAFIGDYHLMGRPFELEDLTIRNGVGDVKIDLTKAIIPEGETVIAVQAFIGDVDIYVPYDLDLSVIASVTIGDLEILSEKQGGFGRQVSIKTKNYETSTRRVKLILSLTIGDIDVKVL